MAHILVDTANTFFRARHVIRGDTSEKYQESMAGLWWDSCCILS